MKLSPKQFRDKISSISASFETRMLESLITVGVVAEKHFDDNFEKEGFLDSTSRVPWKKNEPSTIAKKGSGKKILEDTGDLRNSRRKSFRMTGENKTVRIEYSGSVTGNKSTFLKATAMNEGFEHKNAGSIPARKFIGYSYSLVKKSNAIFRKDIHRLFKTNFNLGR